MHDYVELETFKSWQWHDCVGNDAEQVEFKNRIITSIGIKVLVSKSVISRLNCLNERSKRSIVSNPENLHQYVDYKSKEPESYKMKRILINGFTDLINEYINE